MIKILFMTRNRLPTPRRVTGSVPESHPTKVGVRPESPWSINNTVTTEQIHLLRKSFDIIERQEHVAALVFYQHLFEIDPSLRRLFRTEIEEQSRKLMDMLGLAVSLLGDAKALEPELERLGARHVTYGVRNEHYTTVGQAMLHMLAKVLGPEWTTSTRAAWTEFYGLLAASMMRGVERPSEGLPVPGRPD